MGDAHRHHPDLVAFTHMAITEPAIRPRAFAAVMITMYDCLYISIPRSLVPYWFGDHGRMCTEPVLESWVFCKGAPYAQLVLGATRAETECDYGRW